MTSTKVDEGAYTRYTLTAIINGQRYVAQHLIHKDTYNALVVKDANDLIESQLWQQLMHTIEHHLRKAAYANAKDPHRRH